MGLIISVFVVTMFGIFGIYQILGLRKAHSTFENYYAFRDCVQLLARTADTGTCKTATGQVIKIVKLQNKWYLENDGPGV